MQDEEVAEKIGRFREILEGIAQGGPDAGDLDEYSQLRKELVDDPDIRPLLPNFIIEYRTPRSFWNYIQPAFSSYAKRSQYIEFQLVPIERQFRPGRQRAPGLRPPEVRIEYSPVRPAEGTSSTLVSEKRLAELRVLKPPGFDLQKLIRLCEELNTSFDQGCYLATVMLTRAVLDHVPPIFGMENFREVASNYGGGGTSFKGTMERLERTARKIADGYLHVPIRASETLPTHQQVNFGAELDTLIAEIIRVLSSN